MGNESDSEWEHSPMLRQARPCPAQPCPARPCPALPCPALPCPALPCPASTPACLGEDTLMLSHFKECLAIVSELCHTHTHAHTHTSLCPSHVIYDLLSCAHHSFVWPMDTQQLSGIRI